MSGGATKPAARPRPLAISLMLGLSGWVAGGFMLMFVAMLFEPDTPGQFAAFGLLLLAAAWGLFKLDDDGAQAFVPQLALALSIAGQCFVLFAMTKGLRGLAPIAGAALLLQAALALAMPNHMHRVMSTLFALIAWALTVRLNLFGEPGSLYGRIDPRTVSLPASLAGWVLTWAPVAGGLWWAIRHEAAWSARSWAPALSSIVTGMIAGLAFATIASYPLESAFWLGAEGPNRGHLALWPLLSALGAMGALAAAFELGRRGLMAMCVVAVLLHVACFYYALGTSLLVKSLLMVMIGGAFLMAARVLRKKEPA